MSKVSIHLSIIIIAIVWISGCGHEDTFLTGSNSISGKVGGETFVSDGGRASVFVYKDENFIHVSIGEGVEDPFCSCSTEGREVFFIIKNGVGRYQFNSEVKESYESGDPVVSFFNPSDLDNYISSTGYLEIFSIDENGISGYLDASVNAGNYVKGSFRIDMCK
jgi:hypothetical protein